MRVIYLAIRLALLAIGRNVMRASLTVLGILIGVAAVVTVTALGSGARENVTKQIQSIGSNFIIIWPERAIASGARTATGSGPRLTEDDGLAIKREDVSIAYVSPALRARAQLVYGDHNWSTQVMGVTLPFFDVRSWKLGRGDKWTERDELIKTKVCVIGTTVQRELFGTEDPVGRMIRIGRYPYRVIGVLESKGEAPFNGDQDDEILMPISSMRARVMHTSPGFAGVLMLSATGPDVTDHAVKQADAILRQRHHIAEGGAPDFQIRTQKEFQEMQSSIYNLLTLLLIGVAAISLLVGGIGIMNIMLVSVTERTREIGLRMAIGAKGRNILAQFLTEAIVLSVSGAIIGIALGISVTQLLAHRFGWSIPVRPAVIAMAVGFSCLVGIGFGIFPARKASRLDPIEALRYE